MQKGKIYLTLASLYVVQGLPFGFQATALPIVMRQQGASLTAIGLLSLLSLPWICKPLWAPWVDRRPMGGPGRRRHWILASQSLLLVSCLAGALVADSGSHALLLCAVLLMNLCAATQDIAVDALAVDLLSGGQLGPANAAQVVGYKIGMMLGGGLLVWASAWIGWTGLFIAMASIIAIVLLHFWSCPLQEQVDSEPPPETLAAVMPKVIGALKSSGWSTIGVIGGYKVGESMMDVLFKPLLVDTGINAATIGLWVGSVGMGASIAGSLLGGWLVLRWSLRRALIGCALLRMIPASAQLWLCLGEITTTRLAWVTTIEHFVGGSLTTVMFAWMMSRVDRRIGATHFTLLAAVEVLGKSPGAWLAGPVADHFGYPPALSIGWALCAAYVLYLWAVMGRSATTNLRGNGTDPRRT